MTAEQRRLVRENMGLVGVHLRLRVANLAVPRRDREWDDLFQEGCLGLIEAARSYKPERGIPFAAYALPRIHNAVSKALASKFATVRVPPQPRATRSRVSLDVGGCAEPTARSGTNPEGPLLEHATQRERPRRPQVHSLSDEFAGRLPDRRHAELDGREPSLGEAGETIGDRLRHKYDSAVAVARDMVAKGRATRDDRHTLAEILTEERFLVPREESRRSLRQIARDTRSSYARVAQCDKQLGKLIRSTLETDPEFRELQRRARAAPKGHDVPIDDELERALTQASTSEFVRRYRRADPTQRAQMLHTLLGLSHDHMERLVGKRFTSLPRALRERLLRETGDLDERRNAETQKRRNAKTQKRRNAKTQKRRNAETQKRRNGETQKRRNAETSRRKNARMQKGQNAESLKQVGARSSTC